MDQCGDGLRDLLGLILRIEEHPTHAIFIDEPGVRLHPRAQRALLKYLLDASTSRPIWLATHDGVFIGSPDVENRYAVSRADGVTTVRRVDTSEETRLAFHDLGWSPRDAFLCDTILFCEGPSDHSVFSQLLNEPGHTVFQGVEVVQLGGDRIWGRDSARLNTLVSAVQAVAPHARFLALLDRGGHTQSECDQVARLLSAAAVEVFWLEAGELESFWIVDREFCVRLCGLAARSAGVEVSSEKITSSIDASSASQAPKASLVIERILNDLGVRTSKPKLAELAVTLMAEESGGRPKTALVAELLRAAYSGRNDAGAKSGARSPAFWCDAGGKRRQASRWEECTVSGTSVPNEVLVALARHQHHEDGRK